MFGLANPYVLLGGLLVFGIACGISYYKGRESAIKETQEQMQVEFDKAMAEREKTFKADLDKAQESNKEVVTVIEKGKETIKYVDRIVKEKPVALSCLLDDERVQALNSISDSSS